MSTGYSWEGIRQVHATLLGARHVPERLLWWPCLLGALYQVFDLYLYLYGNYGEPIKSHHRATQRTHLQLPMTTSSLQTGGSQPPVKICIANCSQMVPDTMVVCIDSLWTHTIALHKSTMVYHPRGTPSQNGGSHKKINSELRQNCNRYLTALYTRPAGTLWCPIWHHECPLPIGACLPPNLGQINMLSTGQIARFPYVLVFRCIYVQ